MLSSLVVCEVALALLLLIGAGLLLEAFRKVVRVDPGFRREHVISYAVLLPRATYATPEQPISFYRDLLQRSRAIPGVQTAGARSLPPLSGHQGEFYTAEGAAALGPQEQDPVVLRVIATAEYFDAIGMTFLAGTPFDQRDEAPNAPLVAVVNETFAQHFWPHADAVGKRVHSRGNKTPWMENRRSDAGHPALRFGSGDAARCVFLPYPQSPIAGMSMSVVLLSGA